MKYIDAYKLKTWLENEADMEFKKTEENANSPVLCHFHNGCRMQALDTIDFITSLQQEQPELPSNLDEAAEKYQSDARIHVLDSTPIGTAKDAFIAGAEWMAGQFQKIEGDLVDWYETRDVEYCSGIRTHESFKVPSGFYIKKEKE